MSALYNSCHVLIENTYIRFLSDMGGEILFSHMQPCLYLLACIIEKKYGIISVYYASMSHTTFTYFGDLQQCRLGV